jgi:hypothetical protein
VKWRLREREDGDDDDDECNVDERIQSSKDARVVGCVIYSLIG